MDCVNEIKCNIKEDGSSMIKSFSFTSEDDFPVCFEDESIGVLQVVFKTNGSKYSYKDVPFKVFKEMMGSKSYGSYLNKNIKNKYETSREDC